MKKSYLTTLICFTVLTCLALSCGDKTKDGLLPFEVYGRVVWRPPFYGSDAEFYIYHDGQPATDALIIVRADTVPLVNSALGRYSKGMNIGIGDSLDYSIISQFGSSSGSLFIPDTVEIVSPMAYDTLHFGSDFTAIWHEILFADGYFVYLENQDGFAAAVSEARFDTSAILNGINIANGGIDYLWVETLSGYVIRGITPDGRTLPKGVFGTAGNYREIYVSLSR